MIKIKKSKIYWDRDGFFRNVILSGAELTLEDVIKFFQMRLKLSKGKRHPLLLDARNIRSISREGREFGTSDEVKNMTTALAILVDSAISSVIGNFYLGLNKPPYPTKLFTSEEKAIHWLKRFVE